MIDLTTIPTDPGCYLYKNKDKKIIYVGKAKNLRKRVKSYFQKTDHDEKTKILVSLIDDVSFFVTRNEVEALILENNLIKKHQPKYNINLKDDKRYAYIRLTEEEFPRLVLARNKKLPGKYYGPFVSAATRDAILETVIKTFQIRTCNKLPKKACLRYHIKLCPAPCVDLITKIEYMKNIKKAGLVLRGKTKELLVDLEKDMKAASEKQLFERALELRNQINALEWFEEKQTMERDKKYNEDVLNYLLKDGKVYLILFHVYKGILEQKQEFVFDHKDNFLEEFLVQYYDETVIPKEIILPSKIDDSLQEYLEQKKKGKVVVTIPKQGEKKQLLDLVKRNVEINFFGDLEKLDELRTKIRLQETPEVIECFDISHLSGTSTVASMVQFRHGKPDKSNYRRFKIKTVEGIDDFASMAEVVRRRYSRLLREHKEMPNLIVIDGGKGQLSAALDAMRNLGLRIPMISLAKREEEIFLPGLKIPIKLDKKNKGLQLLQAIRDEAHRFAISYNRLLRKKKLKEE